MRPIELVSLTEKEVTNNTPLLELPLVQKVDTWKDACLFAFPRGYRWKDDSNNIFGGYFVNNNGDCLMLR